MAVTGRHTYRASAGRRVLLTVAVLSLMVLAGAVGLRSVIENRLSPTDQSGPPLAGIPSATAETSTTETTTAAPTTTVTTMPSPSATTTRPPSGSSTDVAQALLNQINAWRAADGKAPLTMAAGLVASAHKHNVRMSTGCGMQHQCPDEDSLGTRITDEGITWRAVAENIGWHSSVSSSGVLAAAKGLNEAMYNEVPPNDGHRRNMLNEAYHRIGIDVYRAADGKVWLTQDFAN